jgi:glycosyltransferase involved in cell wall biosynthesis
MEPLVSIIVPTFNEQPNIKRCLQSILAQDYKNIEVIVVDNFSKDKTLEIAQKYTKKCYSFGNERSSQRNFGAQKATGIWLLFIDADMRLTKKCLKEAIYKAQKNKFIIAFPEVSQGDNFWEKSIAFERNLYQKEKILAGARLFPKKLFLKLKGFDQSLVAGEDWNITIRAKTFGYKLVFTNSKIIHKENFKNLRDLLKKKAYYSKMINVYAQKHPQEFAKQSSLKTRLGIYLKNWPQLIANPLHTAGFLFIKSCIWYDWLTKSSNAKT